MRILLVDDHTLFREGLASLFRSQPDLAVVGEAGSTSEAIVKARELKPDLVLMDFSLPDGDGTQATRAILADRPETMIVFLTVHDGDDRLFAAIRCGAKGYLLKNLASAKLLSALRALERDEAAISRNMTARILEQFARLGPRQDPERSFLAELSLREVEVLKELASDASNREISEHLSISETTVKNHVHSLLTKLNFKNRYEAASFARKQGLGEDREARLSAG